MKKSMILAFSVLLVLSGCGNEGKKRQEKKNEMAVEEAINDMEMSRSKKQPQPEVSNSETGVPSSEQKQEAETLAPDLTDSIIDPLLGQGVDKSDIVAQIKNTKLDSPEYLSCLSLNVDNCLKQGIQEKVRKDKSPEACLYFSDVFEKESCQDQFYLTMSVNGEDVSLCEKISKESEKTACANQVYEKIAMEKKDASACEKIILPAKEADNALPGISFNPQENCKNQVYFSLAIEKKDVELCNKISTAQGDPISGKEACVTQIELEKSFEEDRKRFEEENKQNEAVSDVNLLETSL